LYIQAVPETNLLDAGEAFANSALVYFSLSLATTIISTLLIIARIVYIGLRSKTLSRYSTVVETVVESALLYSVNLIVFLPFVLRPDFLSGYTQSALAQITVSLFHSQS
jgi:high-affinity nickel permease